MKTQILHLDSHDDIVSARDRMGWSKADRILLVWPERGNVLHRRLDLTLIQRHSKVLGAQLALVTVDPQVRFNASELGIPVFKTLGRAQKAAWRPPRRFRTRQPILPTPVDRVRPDLAALRRAARPPSPAWLDRRASRLALFLLGIFALLAIVALLVPGAEIKIDPKTTAQTIRLNVQASPNFNTDEQSGKVPSYPQRVTVEGKASHRASGTTRVPDHFASGRVNLTNLSVTALFIPQGTIVLTLEEPAARFETTRPGRVPAGQGASLTLPIRAILPGSSGNLPAGSLGALEGTLGSRLMVTNEEPTKGGSDLRGPAPREQDYERLEAQLRRSLEQTALKELAKGLEPDDLLLEDTISLHRVLQRSFEPETSQPADWLNLDLRLEFEAQVVPGKELQALAARAMDSDQPEGYQPTLGPVNISQLSSPEMGSDGSAHWRLQASRELQALASPAKVILLSRGLLPVQAQQRLAGDLQLASPAQIQIFPAWWPRLPFVPFRIHVIRDQ